MGRIIDVSVRVSPGMLVYPGDPAVSIDRVSNIETGDASNVSILSMSTHTGTHVDPPIHFVRDGATIDELPLETFVGAAHVVDVRGVEAIDAAVLKAADIPRGSERVLFLTDWSSRWGLDPAPPFPETYTAVTDDGAAWLISRGIRLVGTDFISIEGAEDPEHPVHRALLGAGIAVVEGLDLREVSPGACRFVCLPLKVGSGDGGPARAFVELP